MKCKKEKSVKCVCVRLKEQSPLVMNYKEIIPLDLFGIRPISCKTPVIPGGRRF